MNESVRYERCQQIQLGVLTESQEGSVDIISNERAESDLPQGTGNVSFKNSLFNDTDSCLFGLIVFYHIADIVHSRWRLAEEGKCRAYF